MLLSDSLINYLKNNKLSRKEFINIKNYTTENILSGEEILEKIIIEAGKNITGLLESLEIQKKKLKPLKFKYNLLNFAGILCFIQYIGAEIARGNLEETIKKEKRRYFVCNDDCEKRQIGLELEILEKKLRDKASDLESINMQIVNGSNLSSDFSNQINNKIILVHNKYYHTLQPVIENLILIIDLILEEGIDIASSCGSGVNSRQLFYETIYKPFKREYVSFLHDVYQDYETDKKSDRLLAKMFILKKIINEPPLHRAIIDNNFAKVCVLINRRQEMLYYKDKKGNMPIEIACKEGSQKIVEYIFNFQDFSKNFDGKSLLFLAVQNSFEVTDFLLKKIIVEEKLFDKNKNTLLHHAKNKAIIGALLKVKIIKDAINSKNRENNTPLDMSIKKGEWDNVNIFLDNNAETTLDSSEIIQQLIIYYQSPNNLMLMLLKKFVECGIININAYIEGAPLIYRAVKSGLYDLLNTILKIKEVNINLKTCQTYPKRGFRGWSALHLAVHKKDLLSVNYLLARDDIDINSRIEDGGFWISRWHNWRGKTALDIAEKLNDKKIIFEIKKVVNNKKVSQKDLSVLSYEPPIIN